MHFQVEEGPEHFKISLTLTSLKVDSSKKI